MVGIIGDIMQDCILYVHDYPEVGTETTVVEFAKRIGGSACNTAMVLGDLCGKVCLYSQIGDDTTGDSVLEALVKKNVDTSFVFARTNMKSGFIVIAVNKEGQRTMFSYRPEEPLPDCEDKEDAFIRQITLLHLSGYIFLEKRERRICDRIIGKAISNGIPILLDPGISPVKRLPDYLIQKLGDVDFFFPDEKELRFLTGEPQTDQGIRVLRHLLKSDTDLPVIALKRGKEGCALYTRDAHRLIPAVHSVATMNSTGAGDAFNAGFIYGLLNGFAFDKCASIANDMGYQVVKTKESISEKRFVV